jgi:hypothetical protein
MVLCVVVTLSLQFPRAMGIAYQRTGVFFVLVRRDLASFRVMICDASYGSALEECSSVILLLCVSYYVPCLILKHSGLCGVMCTIMNICHKCIN